ncbi:hypothetical protein [Roseibium aquae]|nr:hypothetical protein [Roseibium aquae]
MRSALEKWGDEGGAPAQDSMHSEYGKRIETDGTWTIYHVFSGGPATIGGDLMQGMTLKDTLDQMQRAKFRNCERRAAHAGVLKARFLPTWLVRLRSCF